MRRSQERDKTENSHVKQYYEAIADEYDNSHFNNTYGQYLDRQEREILS